MTDQDGNVVAFNTTGVYQGLFQSPSEQSLVQRADLNQLPPLLAYKRLGSE